METAQFIEPFDYIKSYGESTSSDHMTLTVEKKVHELRLLSRLLAAMVRKGCIDKELRAVLIYQAIVVDAVDYNLNWTKARKDFRIGALCLKYMP